MIKIYANLGEELNKIKEIKMPSFNYILINTNYKKDDTCVLKLDSQNILLNNSKK